MVAPVSGTTLPAMIALIGDVHEWLDGMRTNLAHLPAEVRSVVQVGDLWIWPAPEDAPPRADGTLRELPPPPPGKDVQWHRLAHDVLFIDGNHHNYPLTRGLQEPTPVAPGLTYVPRGTVRVLHGMDGPLRVGFLGGADSVIDAQWRRPDQDWWPLEEPVGTTDVERLLTNARHVGGLDLLVTHTPPASVTRTMMRSDKAQHPSSLMVEDAWRALGGGVTDPPLELICGHMHEAWYDREQRVRVLDFLEVIYR